MPARKPNALRPTTIEPYPTNAPGSILITQGGTRVICTASIAEESPRWMIDKATGIATRGWVTAEYAMLPGSTDKRKRRGTDSRATEIQRLIGRVLRAGVDLEKMAGFIEVQGTGEQGTFSRDQLDQLLDLAAGGIRKLMTIQRKAIRSLETAV